MIAAFLAEAAAHGADAKPAFPPFETWHMPSQLFWLTILFLGLYFVLSRRILPKLAETMKNRTDSIGAQLDEAARLNTESIEAQKALELRLAQARAKARETGDQARTTSEAELATETARIDADLAGKLEKAESRITKLRSDAMQNVEQIAIDAAEAMTSRLGVKASKADLQKAVAAVLEP